MKIVIAMIVLLGIALPATGQEANTKSLAETSLAVEGMRAYTATLCVANYSMFPVESEDFQKLSNQYAAFTAKLEAILKENLDEKAAGWREVKLLQEKAVQVSKGYESLAKLPFVVNQWPRDDEAGWKEFKKITGQIYPLESEISRIVTKWAYEKFGHPELAE